MIDVKRPSAALAFFSALLVACGAPPAPAVPASSPLSAAAIDPGNAGGNKFVTVMTRNLYLGAELGPAMQPGLSPDEFLQATTKIWQMVNRNDFGLRARGVADEIAAQRPELVGLQEAYTWTFRDAAVAPADATVG